MKTKTLIGAIVGSGPLSAPLVKQMKTLGHTVIENGEWQQGSHLDFVVETTNVNMEEKKKNLLKIENIISEKTLILSTCLRITATEAASWLKHPERLVGFAAFSTWEETNLIEIAPALQTDFDYVIKAKNIFQMMGKEVEVVEDGVGCVFPRILSLIINEAAFALTEKIATPEHIDKAMKKGTNYPMGPLAWADHVGIDEIYAVLSGLYKEMGEERYRPAPMLRKMVYAGWLGKKSGRGFYLYES
jgi:3-hydroxybutyryl-CoA dehydrogenase